MYQRRRWPVTRAAVIVALGLALARGKSFAMVSVPATEPPASLSSPDRAASDLHEMLVQVRLKPQMIEETITTLQDGTGMFFIAADDLKRWRINVRRAAPMVWQGKNYYRTDDLPRLQGRFDEAEQILSLELPAEELMPTHWMLQSQLAASPVKPSPGLFVNYDLLGEGGSLGTRASALLELGLFNSFGVGIQTGVMRHRPEDNQFIRLDTTFTSDSPADLASWRMGDAITRTANAWGRSVRFAGLQYATNFAVQPGFIAMPQQNITGQAALPSTAEVFVNNALVSRSNVAPGPFSINNIPVITGQGDVRVVVRDALGREQLIVQPFYATPRLLKPQLNDFSFEVGKERLGYGVDSDRYDRWLASGTWARGLSDAATGQVHAEAVEGGQYTTGAHLAWNSGHGVVDAGAAVSVAPRGHGELLALGYEVRGKAVGLSFRTQVATHHFAQLGIDPTLPAARRLTDASLGLSVGAWGTLSVGYLLQDRRAAAAVELVSLSLSRKLGDRAYGSISLLKSLQGGSDTIGVFLILPMNARTSATTSVQRSSGRDQPLQVVGQMQKALEAGDSQGYRLQASAQGPQQAEYLAQNGVGTYLLGAATVDGESAFRASASGGVAVLDGQAYPSRRITDSFAVVQVPNYAGVRVYADNQLVATTDRRGNALVPRVRAYQKNPITIESDDLPLDAAIGTLSLDAVPYFRSGVRVRFPVQPARGAMLQIRMADGSPWPFDALVRVDTHTTEFPVAEAGNVYVTGLAQRSTVHIYWRDQQCKLPLAYPTTTDPLPFLGVFTCESFHH